MIFIDKFKYLTINAEDVSHPIGVPVLVDHILRSDDIDLILIPLLKKDLILFKLDLTTLKVYRRFCYHCLITINPQIDGNIWIYKKLPLDPLKGDRAIISMDLRWRTSGNGTGIND